MEEDLPTKRHTDCVYFLASPFTCKKGADCEFRHSNIARLNPKDCWYWLAGNCLNQSCAFRHPPLDGVCSGAPSTPSGSASCSASANKTNVPCHFYFNGFCNKGDRCSFLHDVDGNTSTWMSSRTPSACNEVHELSSENKASSGNDTMSAQMMTHLNPSKMASKANVDSGFQPKDDPTYFHEQSVLRDVPQQRQQLIQDSSPKRKLVPEDVPRKSVSPLISVSGDEEAAEIRSDSLPPDVSIHSQSPSCTNQSSEEQADDLLVREECWESSPGFDVLVEGKSENLGGEDDPGYFLPLDGECRELHSHFLGYDFENSDEYVPMGPDAEILYERDIYDSYDRLDRRHTFGTDGRIPAYEMDPMPDSVFFRERKLMPMELAGDDQDYLDLRDRLRRRRVTDGRSITGLSRRNEPLGLFGRSMEKPQRHGMDSRLHGGVALEVSNSTYESLRRNGAFSNCGIQRGSLMHSQQYRSRKHHKERRPAKQQFPLSGVSQKPVPREKKPVPRKKRSAHESNTFTGPKTLAQIKEEKRKAEENGGCIGITRHVRTKVDFQGPKPLNEILKEKGKIADKREDNAGCN